MDFLKKSAAEAGSFLNRAKQFTEEKLGNAERTEYDPEMEVLMRKSDNCKTMTERLIATTTSVLQPNPNERLEDFVLTKLDRRIAKPNNLEILGLAMLDTGNELGTSSHYGATLVKVGEIEKRLGVCEKEFVHKSSECFLQPLKNFMEGQMKNIQKEKKTLEVKRLDLDSWRSKLKKSKEEHKPKPDAEDELRRAQTEFDRQNELTKLLMQELHVTYNHHVQCLVDFVDSQLNYYNNCAQLLLELSCQIGGKGIQANFNKVNALSASNSSNLSSSNTKDESMSGPGLAAKQSITGAAAGSGSGGGGITSGGGGGIGLSSINAMFNRGQKAKVLYDYQATDSEEVSVVANQIINIQILPNNNDWVIADTGRASGRVPKSYIQIVE